MPHVVRSETAERDLERLLNYLDDHRPTATLKMARTINQKCALLAQFPEMGRAREELAPGLRSFSAGDILLFYRPIADGIEVIRIVHGARDLPSLFD